MPAGNTGTPSAVDEEVISAAGLRVAYGSTVALEGVDLTSGPGTVGLLGPNGAGKTSLLRALLGLVRPAAGSVRVAGIDPARRRGRLEVRRRIGYMPEGTAFVPGMNAVELVAALGAVSGLSRADALSRAHEALDYVQLGEARYRDQAGYSTGMRQRLKLAQALVHDPPLLFLDEPTTGLDPRGRAAFLDLVGELGRAGKNVLLSTHLLPDVERVCSRVVILGGGRVLLQASLDSMIQAEGGHVRVELAGDGEAFMLAARELGMRCEHQEDGVLVWLPPGAADADGVFEAAARAETAVEGLQEVRPSLEQIYLEAVHEVRG